jgi:hypothetical protein
MKIGVYQRHIDRGFGGKNAELICPIAIALTEATGYKYGVWHGKAWNMVTGESYDLPEDVTKRYIKYDHTGIMKPFDFEIELSVTEQVALAATA